MPQILITDYSVSYALPNVKLNLKYDIIFNAEDSPYGGTGPLDYDVLIFIAGMDIYPGLVNEALSVPNGFYFAVHDENNKVVGHLMHLFCPAEIIGPDEREGYPHKISRDKSCIINRVALNEDPKGSPEIACVIELVGRDKHSRSRVLSAPIRLDPYFTGKPIHIDPIPLAPTP